MGRLFKILITFLVFGAIGLVGYAYVGPFFGADFSAPQSEVRVPVDLDGS
ncbi:MAG: hypothetical protein HRU30_11480 [Rhodobacteraceae bacterium]|nr:hypothetical protein [Paracoccaceae bacterium]